ITSLGKILFQVLSVLHQCLSVTSREDWDDSTKILFSSISFQITLKGREIRETAAAQAILLENSHGLDFAKASTNFYQDNDEELPQQRGLFEVWMALPEY
ncbi:unnamed protein product, partial [Choristocarpus tenellus]